MYRRGAQGWLKHIDFIMLDLVCLQLAYMLAYAARMGTFSFYAVDAYFSINAVFLLADILVSFAFNSFKNVLKRSYYKELAITLKHIFLVEAVVIIYLFTVQKSATYSRIIIFLTAVLYVCIGYFGRILWKKHLQKALETSKSKRSVFMVTVASMAHEVIANVSNGYEKFHMAGLAIWDCDMTGQEIDGVPVLTKAENVADVLCHTWVDEVLICLPNHAVYPEKLVNQFVEMGLVVHLGLYVRNAAENPNNNESGNTKQFIEKLGNYRVLTTTVNYATPLQQFIKRLVDIIGGIIGLLITGVLCIFLAPAIYILSPGPIFFRQERVGLNGKHFKIYKFRSMYPDAEERKKELLKQNACKDGMMFKMEGDPRVIGTRIMPDGSVKKGLGNFIRDWSLDEFPQFLNVLKGDMSLVGTRPPTVDEWEKYKLHHRARLSIRPGITGLWQVSGRSTITDFEEVVKLDRKYITEWSMGLDCRILLQTVLVVLRKRGAL